MLYSDTGATLCHNMLQFWLFARLACCLTILIVTVRPAVAGNWTQALERGEILAYTHKSKRCANELVAKAIIEASPERVWKLVDHCGGYQRVMPRVRRSKEVSRDGDRVACLLTIDMPFPYSDLTSVTAAEHRTGRGRWSRRWKLRSGDYKVNRGSWSLRRYKGMPGRTYMVYQACVEPKVWVPGWIRNLGQKRILPQMIRNIRAALKKK